MQLYDKIFGYFVLILLLVSKSVFAIKPIKPSSIVVFGDSYSDNGSGIFNISGGLFPPSPPYFEGRFSNGPVWVEYLSKTLNIPLKDYAIAGSTVNSDVVPGGAGFNDEITVPGIRQRVNEYVIKKHEEALSDKKNNNLYTIETIGMDYIYSLKHGLEVPKPEQVVGQIITSLQTLHIEFGIKYAMVNTLPNFVDLPGFSKSNETEKTFLTNLVEEHNKLLRPSLKVLLADFPKIDIYILEMDKFFGQFQSENLKETCLTIDHNGSHVCDDPDKFIFWDNLHITTKVHEILASGAHDVLNEKKPNDF